MELSTSILQRPYRCPGCDREAFVYVQRTTLHAFGNNGLFYSVSCRKDGETIRANECLGEWFSIRPFETETNAISAWNDAIIEMAAAALEILPKDARALKEKRLTLTYANIDLGKS